MRPRRRTRKDSNHDLPREWLRAHCADFIVAPINVRGETLAYTAHYCGKEIILYDLSAYGGVYPDYLIVISGRAAWIEIKEPRAAASRWSGLTDGERWTKEHGGMHFFIISSASDFEHLLAVFPPKE